MASKSNGNIVKDFYSYLLNGILFLLFGIFWTIFLLFTGTIFIIFYIFGIALPFIIGTYCIIFYFINREIIFGTKGDKTTTKQEIKLQKLKSKEISLLLGVIIRHSSYHSTYYRFRINHSV